MGQRADLRIPHDAPQTAILQAGDARILVSALTALGTQRDTLFVTEGPEGYDVLDIAPDLIDQALAGLDPDTRFAIRVQIDGVLEYARADGFAVGLHHVRRDGPGEIRLSHERIGNQVASWSPERTARAFAQVGFALFGGQAEVSAHDLRRASLNCPHGDAVRLAQIAEFALQARGRTARVLAA
jgi:hypothetical protein